MIPCMPIHPKTDTDLLARSRSAVWHPCSQMKHYEQFPLLPIASGSGVWLHDYCNKRYLDAVSSWWVNLFGHCNPDISAAITDQLGKLEHVMLAGFTHEPVVQLSERLREIAPNGLGHCFYASDGASATEIALKMSAHYWRNSGKPDKSQFISLENSYHGETLGALSVTDVALFSTAYGSLIRQQATVPSPDWRKAAAGESAADYAQRCADALEQHFQQHHAHLAAFIIEPLVQGAAGMAMYHPIYLRRARQLCTEYDVHLIADEIAVGMGRTGTMFACEQAPAGPSAGLERAQKGITPDFLCLSKGITGGYLPLSVVMTRDEIYQAFYNDELTGGFLHSHSYTGNPLACRAALAVLEIFEEEDLLQKAQGIGRKLKARFEKWQAQFDVIGEIRGLGAMLGLELVKGPRGQPAAAEARELAGCCLEKGLVILTCGSYGNIVRILAPLVITDAQLEKGLAILEQGLAQISR
jgi:adenosylmethionine-8-amino-7-oxononanoate aminotransferase